MNTTAKRRLAALEDRRHEEVTSPAASWVYMHPEDFCGYYMLSRPAAQEIGARYGIDPGRDFSRYENKLRELLAVVDWHPDPAAQTPGYRDQEWRTLYPVPVPVLPSLNLDEADAWRLAWVRFQTIRLRMECGGWFCGEDTPWLPFVPGYRFHDRRLSREAWNERWRLVEGMVSLCGPEWIEWLGGLPVPPNLAAPDYGYLPESLPDAPAAALACREAAEQEMNTTHDQARHQALSFLRHTMALGGSLALYKAEVI